MHNIFLDTPKIPLQEVTHPLLEKFGLTLTIKRLDLIHPLLSGNKFFKLKYNLHQAIILGYKKVLTFGGAFSNHIYATSAAAKLCGLDAIGIIRGEEHLPLNPTLSFAISQGMELCYWNRDSYKNKDEDKVKELLSRDFGEFYLIPEGGTNAWAIKGTSEILDMYDEDFDVICTPIGTGGTFAGIVNGKKAHQKVMGFSALKGDFIFEEMSTLLKTHFSSFSDQYEVINDCHFGGYGKFKPELIEFMLEFYEQTRIPLDPVYTGKMMHGIFKRIENGQFLTGQRILALHTGGLQGILGFNQKHKTDLPLF